MKFTLTCAAIVAVILICLGITGWAQENNAVAHRKIRIVLVGDSTVNDGGGWGYGFKQYLTGDAECINTAANGRSSKSFINEGRWQKALELKGDYYFIQFGHNDEPGKGPERETDPNSTYITNLDRYVDETRANGAEPILVTSLTRRNFDKSGNGKLVPNLEPYVMAMKRVAEEKNVPLIDLHTLSVALCEQLGPDATADFNAQKDGKPDTTHLSTAGKMAFARVVVDETRKVVPELRPYLLAEPVSGAEKPKSFNVRTFGAKGDGKTYDTPAIQAALDVCAGAGGGTVEVPAGTYLIRPIVLKGDRLTLQLDAGARLQGSANFLDYPERLNPAIVNPLINAENLNDLKITGQGVIDGAGAAWWPVAREAMANGGSETRRRPRLVLLSHCSGAHVEGITLENSPSFHLVTSECQDTTIEGVMIKAPADSPKTDGVEVSLCRHLVIDKCIVDTGGDDIAVKSGRRDATGTNAAVEDVVVEDCTFGHGDGVTIGSELAGGVKNVTVRDCSFNGTTSGFRIKSDRTRGGVVDGCVYTNLTMHGVKMPFDITMYYPSVPEKDIAQPMSNVTPCFRNIRVVDLVADDAQNVGEVIGLPESRVQNLTFENVRVDASGGLKLRNVRAVVFKKQQVKVSQGKAFMLETNAEVSGL